VTAALILKLHAALIDDLPGEDVEARALSFITRMVGLEDEVRSIISSDLASDATT
jgi:hypothetical protein